MIIFFFFKSHDFSMHQTFWVIFQVFHDFQGLWEPCHIGQQRQLKTSMCLCTNVSEPPLVKNTKYESKVLFSLVVFLKELFGKNLQVTKKNVKKYQTCKMLSLCPKNYHLMGWLIFPSCFSFSIFHAGIHAYLIMEN